MDVEAIRNYCLTKAGATETFPFGPETLVFKVVDKIFLLLDLQLGESFNVKCDPEKAIVLREQFSEIVPGYHMNKKHWNTVYLSGGLNRNLITEMIDDSYLLVFKSLPKKVQQEIEMS